jgi:tetratricopeptide (TPR) repeat protein
MPDALKALERIDGKVPVSIRDDIEFLRSNIYLALARPVDAVGVLQELQSSDDFGGFAAYNLGIAYLQNGQRDEALLQLDRAGQMVTEDPANLAIRDKSNIVLGTILLEGGDFSNAIPYLNRVRLDGPFSNQALLSAGWASMSGEDFERAVVPWSILAEREVTDGAAQEAMLALPYAYGKLDVHGRAAVYYGRALDSFGVEVDKLTESIDSIREGKFLQALIREEIRKSEDWVIRLRSLPETPETYYLMELLATHDFQTGLQNYLDLSDLRRKLVRWQASFDSFDDIIAIRDDHYEPLLPDIDTQFRELDSRLRLRTEQHKMLVKRRDDLLTTPRPEFLATREEQAILARIELLENQILISETRDRETLQRRVRRLKGMLTWTLETEYHDRLTEFDRNLRSLDAAMATSRKQYEQYVRARQAATHSYVGYDDQLNQLRTRVAESIRTVDMLMARQGRALEVVAIDELAARRSRLENYRDKARFALADSYDRASQAQARSAEP